MCEYNMIVKALAEDFESHYITISNFVSGMSNEIEKIFSQVLMVCNEMGLIKGKMFAIDGYRLPLSVSKNDRLFRALDKIVFEFSLNIDIMY